MQYCYSRLPGMDWLLLPHRIPPKESKPLDTRTVYTYLFFFMYRRHLSPKFADEL